MTEHRPAGEITSEARDSARREAERRRLDGKEGRKTKGGRKNEPGQRAHAEDEAVHKTDVVENTDREMDDLYATEAENEVTEWRRHSDLDAPAPRPGYVHRFIRVRLGSTRDTARYRAACREGWRPVRASSFDGHSLPTTQIDGVGEVIGVEDLILCEMPQRVFDQRQAFYRQKLADQNAAIERDLRKQSRDDVPGFGPIEQTRRSRISTSAARVLGVADDE